MPRGLWRIALSNRMEHSCRSSSASPVSVMPSSICVHRLRPASKATLSKGSASPQARRLRSRASAFGATFSVRASSSSCDISADMRSFS